ncbi:hypothetical protein L4C36_18575 [Photobacterium japonica]|uniref:hypothetical protein n=1 Tax=Photobacterium japonica TaxID=2910235 RepID=UPI003D0DD49F
MNSEYMDAYSVDPYFFAPKKTASTENTDWLLLLESAAEYPWGVDVYVWPTGSEKPVKLGEIPVITASEDDGNSLIPYLDVNRNNGYFEISVDIETVFLSETITATYPAGSVKYVEKDGKLVMERIQQ